MDSYNRGYNAGLIMQGDSIGNARIAKTNLDGVTLNLDSGVIRNQNTNDRLDDDIGFYAIAYDYNGQKVISYRGTDDADLDVRYRRMSSGVRTHPDCRISKSLPRSVSLFLQHFQRFLVNPAADIRELVINQHLSVLVNGLYQPSAACQKNMLFNVICCSMHSENEGLHCHNIK